jgi:pimeloyl-ACP methyl ester carboxylesterase
MTTAFVPVPGGQLNVVEDGSPGDPTILLLHAAIADLRSWDELVPPLVTAGYGMEAPDELAALIVEFLAPLPRRS